MSDIAGLNASHRAILAGDKRLGYGKLLLHVEDVDGNGNAIAQLRTACVPCDNLESCCRMTVRDHRDVVERWNFVLIVVHQLQFDGIRIPVRSF